MRNLSILLILGLFVGSVISDCRYTNGHGQYSGGCIQDCKDYATVSAAMAACDQISNCGGVTYSYKSIGGNGATNAIGNGWGYQLRAAFSGSKSPNRENSWLKAECPNPNIPFSPCDYTESQGTYLSGCAQNCKDFSTLDAALEACRSDASCGGVTFSRKEIGGSSATNAFDGVWGFQLRAGKQPISTPNGENSWTKGSCPVNIVQSEFCNYASQNFYTFEQVTDYEMNDETYALYVCDGRPDCSGIVQSGDLYYIARGGRIPSVTNTKAFTKGTLCNNVEYAILFKDCNFQGERVEIRGNIPSIVLKDFKSLYVPQGKSIRLWANDNYKGANVGYKESVYCKDTGLRSFIQMNHGTSSKVSSIELITESANKTARKLKKNSQ